MDGAQKCRATEKKGRERHVDGEERACGGRVAREKDDNRRVGRREESENYGREIEASGEGRGPQNTERKLLLSRVNGRRGEKVEGEKKRREGIKEKKQSWRRAEQSGEAEGDTEMSSEDSGETFQAGKGRGAGARARL